MQRFTGEIEGFYAGTPDAAGFGRHAAKALHYKLEIYRAVVRRVTLLEPEPQREAGAETNGEAPRTRAEGALLADTEPLPPGTLRQDTIADARLSPLRVRAGWFEGPIHDVTVSEFRSTHSAKARGRLYGRFVGRVQASFELPEKPLPPRAQALLHEFTAEEAPEAPETRVEGAETDETTGAAEPASADAASPGAALETTQALEAPAQKPAFPSQLPLYFLVAAGTIGIFALCNAARAVTWLVFLLPTLLLRRILRGALADAAGVRVVSVVMVLGQLGCLGVLGSSWWANGCKELALLPVLGLVFGVFVSSAMPSNLPLLVNALALCLALGAWCSAFGQRCQERAPAAARAGARPSVDDPGVPRTNSDGSWPRRPPRDLPAHTRE